MRQHAPTRRAKTWRLWEARARMNAFSHILCVYPVPVQVSIKYIWQIMKLKRRIQWVITYPFPCKCATSGIPISESPLFVIRCWVTCVRIQMTVGERWAVAQKGKGKARSCHHYVKDHQCGTCNTCSWMNELSNIVKFMWEHTGPEWIKWIQWSKVVRNAC